MKYEFSVILPAIGRRFQIAIGDLYWRIVNAAKIAVSGVSHGKDLRVRGPAHFLSHRKADIVFGDNVAVQSRGIVNPVGIISHSIFHTLYGGKILVGSNTGMSAPTISSKTRVEIGARCKIGGNVRIYDHDFHALEAMVRSSPDDVAHIRSAPIKIGNDVFIGVNAIILKGTRIGDRSIVAAGAVVFGLDIPADSMVKGNPAVVVTR